MHFQLIPRSNFDIKIDGKHRQKWHLNAQLWYKRLSSISFQTASLRGSGHKVIFSKCL